MLLNENDTGFPVVVNPELASDICKEGVDVDTVLFTSAVNVYELPAELLLDMVSDNPVIVILPDVVAMVRPLIGVDEPFLYN